MVMTEFEKQTTEHLMEIKSTLGVMSQVKAQVDRHEVLLNHGEEGVVLKSNAAYNKIKEHIKNHWTWITLVIIGSSSAVSLVIFILSNSK